MPLTTGSTYVACIDLPAFDTDDKVPHGVRLTALSPDRLCDLRSGRVWTLKTLQRNRTEWFLQRVDGFNPPGVQVPTLKELVWEAVRAYPDLMREELYSLLMECRVRARFSVDTVSGALSDDPRIEMFKDGVRVEKVGHNARYCTFRPKGWQPAYSSGRMAAE